MKAAILPSLLVLAACAGQPASTDFFETQANIAAQRERETVVVDAMAYQDACAHVTAVLMDLDCSLQEINSELGVVSGYSISRWVPQRGFTVKPYLWQSCAGHRVTVTVTQRPRGDLAIRASFTPGEPAAEQTFKTLLRKSLALE